MSCGRLARPCDMRRATERKPEADPYVPSARLMLRAMVRPLSVSVRTSSARWATAATWRPSTHHLSNGMRTQRTLAGATRGRPSAQPPQRHRPRPSATGATGCANALQRTSTQLHKPVVPVAAVVPLPPSVLRECTRASARSLETQQRRVLGVLRVLRNARSLETQQRRVVIFSPTRVLEMYLDLHSVSFYAAPAQRSFATECGADAHTLVHVTRTLHAPTHGPSIRTRTHRTGIQ